MLDLRISAHDDVMIVDRVVLVVMYKEYFINHKTPLVLSKELQVVIECIVICRLKV